MKECKDEKKDLNPLKLKGGDVVEQIDGYSKGNHYIVTKVLSTLTLHDLKDGSLWSSECLMGVSGTTFKKVNVCFNREE